MAKIKKCSLKSPVYVRTRTLHDGRKSIYLDINRDGVRRVKFLRMYLEPGTSILARRKNADVMRQVEKIKNELVLEIIYTRAGLEDRSFKADIKLVDWFNVYREHLERHGCSSSFRSNIVSTRKYIEAYNCDALLKDVDGRFVDGFISFLKKQRISGSGGERHLAHNTVNCRVCNLHSALNFAVREKLIAYNPCLDAETKADELETRREYLTVEEVKRLIDAPCGSPVLKRAFLFSVFCALRLGDVKNLTWKNLVKDADRWRIEIRQQKTGAMLYVPLNRMAREWIVEPADHAPDDKIFKGLRRSHRVVLQQWVATAGIKKLVTYHTSRHSFAVLSLHAGVDIYTLSKLMGHTSVEKTLVYANIMTDKMRNTVALLDHVLD